MRFVLRVALMLSLVLVGCAGNGAGLDENGNPIGTDGGLPVAFDPTFDNIQQNVFTPICTQCHIGPGAPQGMRLDESNAYEMIVGVASAERPDLLRVNPGNPNASYLVRKLEGGPDIVGDQMPRGLAPLPQPVINAIRVWIERGAQR